jgi:transposase
MQRASLHWCARNAQLPGFGATTATAVVAMIGNGHEFKCGRQFAAWLALTPGQYSSGGKTRLGRITKAGDGYLRSLLILGARSVLALARGRSDALSNWALAPSAPDSPRERLGVDETCVGCDR